MPAILPSRQSTINSGRQMAGDFDLARRWWWDKNATISWILLRIYQIISLFRSMYSWMEHKEEPILLYTYKMNYASASRAISLRRPISGFALNLVVTFSRKPLLFQKSHSLDGTQNKNSIFTKFQGYALVVVNDRRNKRTRKYQFRADIYHNAVHSLSRCAGEQVSIKRSS